MSSTHVNRRQLLRSAAIGAAAMTAASYNRVLGANERIGLGLIGCGNRGRSVMTTFVNNSSIQVNALCDVYPARIDEAASIATNAKGHADHRALLDQRDVDAVLIATPDHWHAGCCIDAANAGKDIYCEKPLTLKIEEGPEIVKAVRVNERVCQVGMQQRSGKHYLEAKQKFFDTGAIGKVTMARTWWYGNGAHLRPYPEGMESKPSNLDWARFLGPVKWQPWDPKKYFNFRAYLEFGGGQITDLFTHWIDVVHMFMEQDNPVAAVASGGIYQYKDGRTAPDTILCALDYPEGWTATFEATLAPGKKGAAVEMVGTQGSLFIDRSRYEWQPIEGDPVVVEAERRQGVDVMTQDHVDNFVDCVKTRKEPNGDVWIGHRSAQASHLGNIAYLQKRRVKFDPHFEEILPL